MRDPKRIRPLLNELAILWEKNPDLRLGQLLYSLSVDTDVFYMEDDVLLQKIRQYRILR